MVDWLSLKAPEVGIEEWGEDCEVSKGEPMKSVKVGAQTRGGPRNNHEKHAKRPPQNTCETSLPE